MDTKYCRSLKLTVANGQTKSIILETLSESGWKNVQSFGDSAITAIYFIPEPSNDGTIARLGLTCNYRSDQIELQVRPLNDGIEPKKCQAALSSIVSSLEDSSR